MLPSFTISEARRGLERLNDLKVAVVGETIIDEYAFCDAIGKSGKEPMLVTRFSSCQEQAGGVLAIANHVAQFCGEVEVVSALGSSERREEFVRGSLASNVRGTFITKSGSPTIVKRRYVDAYTRAKMLGVYKLEASPLAGADLNAMHTALESALATADIVVVADYGHGLLPSAAVDQLCSTAPFLALNTQLNAANHGYNVLSKYRRADYACLHEGELRLDARDLEGDLRDLLVTARSRLGASAVMATLGKSGTWLNTADGDYKCRALASSVVERVGAGDAVLALSSIAVAAQLRPEFVGILANLAGAQAVAQLGNKASILKSRVEQQLAELASAPSQREVG